MFAQFVLQRPHLKIRPLAIRATAEVLTPEARDTVERAFQSRVYNFYGSREINNLAAECPSGEGLHVNALGRYIEIVDEVRQAASRRRSRARPGDRPDQQLHALYPLRN